MSALSTKALSTLAAIVAEAEFGDSPNSATIVANVDRA